MKFYSALNHMMSFFSDKGLHLPGQDYVKNKQQQYFIELLTAPQQCSDKEKATISDFFIKNYHRKEVLKKLLDSGYKLSESDFWHVTRDPLFVRKHAHFLSGEQLTRSYSDEMIPCTAASRELAKVVKELLPQYEAQALEQWRQNLQGNYLTYQNIRVELFLHYQIYKRFWLKRLDMHQLDCIKEAIGQVKQCLLKQKEEDIRQETFARAKVNHAQLYSPKELYERRYKGPLLELSGFFTVIAKDFNTFKADSHYFMHEENRASAQPMVQSKVVGSRLALPDSIKEKLAPAAYECIEEILKSCEELSANSRLTAEQDFSINNISTKILPQAVNAYLAIDAQHRDNSGGEKNANELFMEALNNLQAKLTSIKSALEDDKLVTLKQVTYYTRSL